MKTKKILSALMLILMALFLFQCEKGRVKPDRADVEDEDSDRPEWAGKDGTGDNPHPSTNPSPGITKGGDYGDLYELARYVNGEPVMVQYNNQGEWFVQPIDEFGNHLDINEEGELVNPDDGLEVEFGRLNIVRSPPSVLEQAFEEAMKVIEAPGAVISLDFCGRLTSTYEDGGVEIVKTTDSPRENMAIYKYIMSYMFEEDEIDYNGDLNRLYFLGEPPYNYDPLVIAASCFAAGSDKTGTVNVDELVYINGFMKCIGLNPIENPNDYDFDLELMKYFNFTDCYGDASYAFNYDRTEYDDRYVQFLVWDGVYHDPVDEFGDPGGEIMSIKYVMDNAEMIADYYDPLTEIGFTMSWGEVQADHGEGARLFAVAIDDAVQVLELVHEDSNIRFLPGYTE